MVLRVTDLVTRVVGTWSKTKLIPSSNDVTPLFSYDGPPETVLASTSLGTPEGHDSVVVDGPSSTFGLTSPTTVPTLPVSVLMSTLDSKEGSSGLSLGISVGVPRSLSYFSSSFPKDPEFLSEIPGNLPFSGILRTVSLSTSSSTVMTLTRCH